MGTNPLAPYNSNNLYPDIPELSPSPNFAQLELEYLPTWHLKECHRFHCSCEVNNNRNCGTTAMPLMALQHRTPRKGPQQGVLSELSGYIPVESSFSLSYIQRRSYFIASLGSSPALKLSSIGLRSGEYGGMNFRTQPIAIMRMMNYGFICMERTDLYLQRPLATGCPGVSCNCQEEVRSDHLGRDSWWGAIADRKEYKDHIAEWSTHNFTDNEIKKLGSIDRTSN